MIEALKQQLVRHEGLRLKLYKDTVGKLTIGVGRNLDDVGISEAEAMILLDSDIATVVADLDNRFPWWRSMSEARQRTLADMCFNLGITRLSRFEGALKAMEFGDYETAAQEMLNSRWSVQVGKRAQTLAEMMKVG